MTELTMKANECVQVHVGGAYRVCAGRPIGSMNTQQTTEMNTKTKKKLKRKLENMKIAMQN